MEAIHAAVRTDSDLAPHLNDERSLSVFWLIVHTGPGEGKHRFSAWGKHLAPILASGAKSHPEKFLPEVANALSGRTPSEFYKSIQDWTVNAQQRCSGTFLTTCYWSFPTTAGATPTH